MTKPTALGLKDKADEYAEFIKPSDAGQTLDDELRVLVDVLFDQLHVKSAYRDSYGQIYADACKATNTVLSADHVTKITDARQVRR